MADSNAKGSAAKGTSGTARRSSAAKSRAKPASAASGSGGTKRSASSNGRANSSSNARSKTPRANARTKPKPASGRSNGSAASSRSSTPARASGGNGSQNGNGIVGSVKQVAGKAKGPAIAVGAAAAVVGGIALKGRARRRTVLGIPVPKHMASVDARSLAKTVGEASTRFAKTSKTVSKDLERAGDQAERIGKILK